MNKKPPLFIQIVFVALAYILTAKLGQVLAIPPGNVTPLWPPSGVALACILLLGYPIWPGIWIGTFVSTISPLFTFDHALPTILGVTAISFGACLEALAGAFVLKKATGGINPIKDTYSAFIFIVFSSLVSCLINSTIGATSLLMAGFVPAQDYWITWLTWWLGDSAGVLTITPIMILGASSTAKDFTKKKLMEAFFLLIPISLIGYWLFTHHNQLAFLFIPFVIWAIFRLGSFWSSLVSLLISFIAISYILQGHFIFGGTSANQSSLLFQAFIAVVFVIDLVLSSLMNEREQAYQALSLANQALKQVNDKLEIKVQERTAELSHTLQELKNKEAQLLQSEKMSSLGTLTAGIAHEINNPINFVSSNISPLRRNIQDMILVLNKYTEAAQDEKTIVEKNQEITLFKKEMDLSYTIEETQNLLAGIQEGAERTAAIVKDLKTFSRLDEADIKKVDIHQNIDATVTLLQHKLGERIEVIKQYGTLPQVECFPGKLNQCIMSVLDNAIEAIEGQGTILIKTSLEGQNIAISIKDTGKGISQENLGRIFDPFFTTRRVGKGTGLGLTIVYAIVKEHQGTIQVKSEVDKGTEVIIIFPISPLNS